MCVFVCVCVCICVCVCVCDKIKCTKYILCKIKIIDTIYITRKKGYVKYNSSRNSCISNSSSGSSSSNNSNSSNSNSRRSCSNSINKVIK